MWQHTGKQRPDFALEPAEGQESVWDYPRPPALDPAQELVDVSFRGVPLASSRSALRVLETAHPPTYYLPAEDIDWRQFLAVDHSSYCEWKGIASYFVLKAAPDLGVVAWRYAKPAASFAALDNHASFYPAKVDCQVNLEPVTPQPGEFYGGWITSRVVGPFKGEPGTRHW